MYFRELRILTDFAGIYFREWAILGCFADSEILEYILLLFYYYFRHETPPMVQLKISTISSHTLRKYMNTGNVSFCYEEDKEMDI